MSDTPSLPVPEAHPAAAAGRTLAVVGATLLLGVGVVVHLTGEGVASGAGPAGRGPARPGSATGDGTATPSPSGGGITPGSTGDTAPADAGRRSAGAPPATSPAGPVTTASAPLPPLPAQAGAGDCVALTADGDLSGLGSCSGGTPYRVTEVVGRRGRCEDPGDARVPSGDHRLCLEVDLVEGHCYSLPEGRGFITAAPACGEPGTVHVVQVVRGARDGGACTTPYAWDWYYPFTSPRMVACVVRY